MKVAFVAFGLLVLTGCVRATEGMVRERAASAFDCADYALHVEEVGPDVYRASGCGQELIYACQPAVPPQQAGASGELSNGGAASGPTPRAPAEPSRPEGDEPVMECARRP